MKAGAWVIVGLLIAGIARAGGWSEIDTKRLPDTSFAAVETDASGQKHRHCPFRDAAGKIDADQLIWVLGRLDAESWLWADTEKQARSVLERHYQRVHDQQQQSDPPLKIDLNSATASELVRLPGIGPVLAVRIIEYRSADASFSAIEDVMKVRGIDRSKFAAIRHYITVK